MRIFFGFKLILYCLRVLNVPNLANVGEVHRIPFTTEPISEQNHRVLVQWRYTWLPPPRNHAARLCIHSTPGSRGWMTIAKRQYGFDGTWLWFLSYRRCQMKLALRDTMGLWAFTCTGNKHKLGNDVKTAIGIPMLKLEWSGYKESKKHWGSWGIPVVFLYQL